MERLMVRRPDDMNAFEFAVLAGLRAAQLHRGCTPRVDRSPKVAVTAQHEVAQRKVLPVQAAAGPFSAPND
jgi:DNA-directed RNA polymerase subunit K/omega